MVKKISKSLTLWSLVVGIFTAGTTFPALAGSKGSIIGKVSSVNEINDTLTLLKNIVEVDASGAKIKVKGLDGATISDINVGDIIKVTGTDNKEGIIEANKIKDPSKLNSSYDGKFTGETEDVSTSGETFAILGQEIDASSLSSVNMGSGRTIPFSSMRSGVSVDVYVTVKSGNLVAESMAIRSESCGFCHSPK